MDGDVERRQALRLIKAFLSITDARKWQRSLNLPEQLVDDAAADAARLASAETSPVDNCGDGPGRVE